MVFRDDREALRQRIAALRQTTGALEVERDTLFGRLEAVEAEIDRAARARARRAVRIPLIATLVVGLSVTIAMTVGGEAEADVRFAWVAGASGAAPEVTGNRCTLFMHRQEREVTKMDVLCPNGALYGGGSAGYLPCFAGEGTQFGRCEDRQSDDGDPQFLYDAAAGTVVVANPGWRVDLRLYRDGSRDRGRVEGRTAE